MSDKDLLKSLEISPEEPYVLNYLAYSWLERKYKINEAIEMLQRAYKLKKNDPYIIDSVGWGYYLIGDYIRAEKYLVKAVQFMPDDPIVNDHYAEILWKLNRKIQAKYFWENVLEMSRDNFSHVTAFPGHLSLGRGPKYRCVPKIASPEARKNLHGKML